MTFKHTNKRSSDTAKRLDTPCATQLCQRNKIRRNLYLPPPYDTLYCKVVQHRLSHHGSVIEHKSSLHPANKFHSFFVSSTGLKMQPDTFHPNRDVICQRLKMAFDIGRSFFTILPELSFLAFRPAGIPDRVQHWLPTTCYNLIQFDQIRFPFLKDLRSRLCTASILEAHSSLWPDRRQAALSVTFPFISQKSTAAWYLSRRHFFFSAPFIQEFLAATSSKP